jgi:integrase
MASFRFIIQGKRNPSNIYIRIKEGRTIDIKAKTKFAINPNDWSSTKEQPKNIKDSSAKKLNENLINLKTELLNHYNNCVGNTTISSEWLKEFINPTSTPESIPTKLIEYIDYYSKYKKNEVGASTLKKHSVYKGMIEKFEAEIKKQYLIKDVNAEFKYKFEEFCLSRSYAPNTIARTIKFVKSICYHARTNGLETHYQLDTIKTKTSKVDKIYLTNDEIDKIQNVDLEQEYLQNARDWLIVSCETGQRVSDFLRFSKEQIRIEGKAHLIEFTQVKTNKTMTIPLSNKVREILKIREGNFPRKLSDQRYNEYIKQVCKIAGINEKTKGSKLNTKTNRKENGVFEKWELVTSHIGRRSFATNNYGRIPTSLLIGATGHSTEKMFLEYIGKTDTQKAIQLAEYF